MKFLIVLTIVAIVHSCKNYSNCETCTGVGKCQFAILNSGKSVCTQKFLPSQYGEIIGIAKTKSHCNQIDKLTTAITTITTTPQTAEFTRLSPNTHSERNSQSEQQNKNNEWQRYFPSRSSVTVAPLNDQTPPSYTPQSNMGVPQGRNSLQTTSSRTILFLPNMKTLTTVTTKKPLQQTVFETTISTSPISREIETTTITPTTPETFSAASTEGEKQNYPNHESVHDMQARTPSTTTISIKGNMLSNSSDGNNFTFSQNPKNPSESMLTTNDSAASFDCECVPDCSTHYRSQKFPSRLPHPRKLFTSVEMFSIVNENATCKNMIPEFRYMRTLCTLERTRNMHKEMNATNKSQFLLMNPARNQSNACIILEDLRKCNKNYQLSRTRAAAIEKQIELFGALPSINCTRKETPQELIIRLICRMEHIAGPINWFLYSVTDFAFFALSPAQSYGPVCNEILYRRHYCGA